MTWLSYVLRKLRLHLAWRLKNNTRKWRLIDVVNLNFPVGSKIKLVVIGANDGISFDDFSSEVFSTRSLEGVMVEPVKAYYQELKRNLAEQKGLIFLNKAVADEPFKIYKVASRALGKYPDGAKGLASSNFEHLRLCGVAEADVEVEDVEAIDGKSLWAIYPEQIDLLQIDTEGSDYKVWQSLEVEKLRPSICKVEILHLKYWDAVNLISELEAKGYCTQITDGDCIAFDPRRLKLP